MLSKSEKNVDLLAGNMSNLSFDGYGTPGGTGLFPNQNITKRRTRPAGINDSPSPVKPSIFPYEDTSNMDIDEVSQPDMDVSNSPKKLPPKFYERATSNKTQRVVSVCKMYFLEYYCDMFDYVISRRQRTKQVLEYLQQQSQLPNSDQIKLNEEWSSYLQREHQVLRKRRLKPKNRDFEMITQVGQGGYGQVYLARKKDTKEVCALKILNKKLLFKLNETKHVLTERDILTTTRSEWLVKLLDLKPENFLIDAKGHIKLTDFGLAAGTISNERIESMKIRLEKIKDLEFPAFTEKSIEDRRKMYNQLREKEINYANSMVGSPDYMALEVLEGKKYDFTVDYWSLGCMLFESLVGYTPFSGSSTNETYDNLRRWKQTLRRPRQSDGRAAFSDRTWDLITRLIADPINRLRSFEHVKRMSYFADINFSTLRSMIPPFTPQLDSETDAGYFDDFTSEADMAKYADVFKRQDKLTAMVDDSAVSSKLVGFTFRHRNGKQGSSGILFNGLEHSDPFSTFY
ncbi:XXYS1_4_G0036280.mRNA.1.CDS.1 [Saccharomyces cerevisiae]|nr:XXYS1_4_G0036280.mRNA.1.CDS.1 [Saccharomyces cerevisiae]